MRGDRACSSGDFISVSPGNFRTLSRNMMSPGCMVFMASCAVGP